MSALKIGPKLCNEFGFDLYLSENEAFFFIEPCKTEFRRLTSEGELGLKRALKEMHLLSIVHKDIKPDNIMYSPSF
jgi:serine/threonine protein kinase